MASVENVRSGAGSSLAWFGVAAAPLAWAAQLLLGYSMQEAGCGRPDSSLWGTGIKPLTAVVLAVSAALAVAGGAAAVTALRDARSNDPRGRVGFVAISGIVATVVFGFAIALSAIPLLTLHACHPG